MDNTVDLRDYPFIEVVDTYTKQGKHLRSVAKTPDGRVIWDEGREPGKDVSFSAIDPMFDYLWKFWCTPQEDGPDCKMDGCRNKSCRRLNSEYCHPHTLLMELKPYWKETDA